MRDGLVESDQNVSLGFASCVLVRSLKFAFSCNGRTWSSTLSMTASDCYLHVHCMLEKVYLRHHATFAESLNATSHTYLPSFQVNQCTSPWLECTHLLMQISPMYTSHHWQVSSASMSCWKDFSSFCTVYLNVPRGWVLSPQPLSWFHSTVTLVVCEHCFKSHERYIHMYSATGHL